MRGSKPAGFSGVGERAARSLDRVSRRRGPRRAAGAQVRMLVGGAHNGHASSQTRSWRRIRERTANERIMGHTRHNDGAPRSVFFLTVPPVLSSISLSHFSHISVSLCSLCFQNFSLDVTNGVEVTERSRSRDRERYLSVCGTLQCYGPRKTPSPHYPQPVMPASAGTLGVAADTATRPGRSAPRLVEGLFRCPSWPRAPGERTEGERKGGERAGEREGVWRRDLPPLGPSEVLPGLGRSGVSTAGLGKCSTAVEACSRSVAERDEGRSWVGGL